MAEKKESLVLFAKDFFGDALDASIIFEQDGRIIHRDQFQDGRVSVVVPDQIEPGVYDVVAQRGDVQYKISSYMIPLATHFFRHSHLHGDLQLEGKNLSGDPIERGKFNSLLYNNLDKLPSDILNSLIRISRNNGNPDSLMWGGMIHVNDYQVVIGEGESSYQGQISYFPETRLDIPTDLGAYRVGIKEGVPQIITGGTADIFMADLYVEGPDWIRLEVKIPYHTIIRGGYSHFFTGYERNSEDATWFYKTSDVLTGLNKGGKIYGDGWTTRPTGKVKMTFNGSGPVLRTDRLYLYATESYFLLWEADTLLSALPRWRPSDLVLEWGRDYGISFDSFGKDGHARFQSARPYNASYVRFRQGASPVEIVSDLEKKVTGFNVLASSDILDWNIRFRTEGASLFWNGDDISSSTLPTGDLFPAPTLVPD